MAIRDTSTSTSSSSTSTSSPAPAPSGADKPGSSTTGPSTSQTSSAPQPGDKTTDGGQIVAPLAPAPDMQGQPGHPDYDQLTTSTAKPWPESITNKPIEGETGQGETDPSLVPAGTVSPTPGYATAPKAEPSETDANTAQR